MSSVGSAADIEVLLEQIGESGELPEPYDANPGALFLAVHDCWVENGGNLSGKPRHSIQNLSNLLEANGTPVPSLRSKINGDTRLKIDEAVALLDHYFSHWSFGTSEGSANPVYGVLQAGNLEKIRGIILRQLFQAQKAISLPKMEKNKKGKSKSKIEEPNESGIFSVSPDFLMDIFETSKAVVHISRIGSVAGPTTIAAIRRFCEIIDAYWKIELKDELGRYLIWLVDPGDRDITNDDSLAAFANAEQLATFFRAVRLLGDPDAQTRWQWLSTHAVVLVGSMDRTITDRLYASHSEKLETTSADVDLIRRNVKYSHFLLDASPPSWLRSPQFAQLYGQEFENLESSAFLIYLDEAETHWRYFGYAPVKASRLLKDGKESFAKYLELASPGPVYDRVASIIHAAACFRLGSQNPDVGKEERLRAIVILRHLDFAVYRLPEFLNAETLSKPPP